MKEQLSRRGFVKALLAGSGLTLFLIYTPRGFRLAGAEELKKADLKNCSLNAWITISPDDRVTITVSQSEMGQGVYTSIPMIVADELEADWKTVRFQAAPASDEYKNPVWGTQSTGGSTSIRHFHDLLRKAGAAAREMLIQAAAQIWSIPCRNAKQPAAPSIIAVAAGPYPMENWGAAASKLPLPNDPPFERTLPIPVYGATTPAPGSAGEGQGFGPFRNRYLYSGHALRRRCPAPCLWGPEERIRPERGEKNYRGGSGRRDQPRGGGLRPKFRGGPPGTGRPVSTMGPGLQSRTG